VDAGVSHAVDLQTFTAILQNIAVLIASLVAIFGIDAWRREHVGKRQMELAEDVLALFYQARDIIHVVRNPLGWGGEGSSRKAAPTESPEEKAALDQAYVVVERYEKHIETFSKLQTLRYRFMAQVGLEKSKPFDDLNMVIRDIMLAARRLGRYWRKGDDGHRTEEQRKRHFEDIRKAEAIFWEGSEDPDPIQVRVESLIKEIEGTCKAILTSKGTLFGIINLPLRQKRG
jgi:hypothetical protein